MSKKLAEIFHRDSFQVGDVVEIINHFDETIKIKVVDINNGWILGSALDFTIPEFIEEAKATWVKEKNLTLIQPAVDISDVLVKFQEVRKFHTTLDISNKGYLTYWESADPDKTKQVDWILKKDGKRLGLWDQSDKCKKFLEEILE